MDVRSRVIGRVPRRGGRRWRPLALVAAMGLLATACHDIDSFDRPDGPLAGSSTEKLNRPWVTDGLDPAWEILGGDLGFAEPGDPAKLRRSYVHNNWTSASIEWTWAYDGPDSWSASGLAHTSPDGAIDSGLRVLYDESQGSAILEDGTPISPWVPTAAPAEGQVGKIEVLSGEVRYLIDGQEVIGWTEWSHTPTGHHGLVASDGGTTGAQKRFSDFRVDLLEEPPAGGPLWVASPAAEAILYSVETISVGLREDLDAVSVEVGLDGQWHPAIEQADGSWTLEWDTTTVANGNHSLGARALDGAGETHEAELHPVVVDNDLTGPQRLEVDLARGLVDDQEFAMLFAIAHTAPSVLPLRFQGGQNTSAQSNELVWALHRIGQVATPETMDLIAAYLEGDDDPDLFEGGDLAEPAGSGAVAQSADAPTWVPQEAKDRWETCRGDNLTRSAQVDLGVLIPFLGRFSLASLGTGAEWCRYREGLFEIRFRPSTFDPAGVPVEPVDADPFAPVRVLMAMAEFEHSYDVYTDLGFELNRVSTSNPLVIYLHGDENYALPIAQGIRPKVNLGVTVDTAGEDPDDWDALYTARHELFHIYQYDLMTAWGLPALGYISDLFPPNTAVWMESTAEWAAAKASVGRNQPDRHLGNLSAFLGDPSAPLFDFREGVFNVGSPPPPRVYGSWILASYLSSRHVGGVLETWREIDIETGVVTAMQEVLDDAGVDLPGFIRGFWVASYLLTTDNDHLIPRFTAPEPGETTLADWRAALGADGTDGDAFSSLHRPARAGAPLEPSPDGTVESVTLDIGSGGAAFLDVMLPSGVTGDVHFAVDAPNAEDFLVTVLAYDRDEGYPSVCARDDFPVAYWQAALASGSIVGEVEIGTQCKDATIMITKHGWESPGEVDLDVWLDGIEAVVPPGAATTAVVDAGETGDIGLGMVAHVRPAVTAWHTVHNVCVRVRAWRSGGLFPSSVVITVRDGVSGDLLLEHGGLETMFTSSPAEWTVGPFLLGSWQSLSVQVDIGAPPVSRWRAEVYSVAPGATQC